MPLYLHRVTHLAWEPTAPVPLFICSDVRFHPLPPLSLFHPLHSTLLKYCMNPMSTNCKRHPHIGLSSYVALRWFEILLHIGGVGSWFTTSTRKLAMLWDFYAGFFRHSKQFPGYYLKLWMLTSVHCMDIKIFSYRTARCTVRSWRHLRVVSYKNPSVLAVARI